MLIARIAWKRRDKAHAERSSKKRKGRAKRQPGRRRASASLPPTHHGHTGSEDDAIDLEAMRVSLHVKLHRVTLFNFHESQARSSGEVAEQLEAHKGGRYIRRNGHGAPLNP